MAKQRKKEIRPADYHAALLPLQIELVKLQREIIAGGRKILIILEGRDAAGKDGTIKAITAHLSPRETRTVALSKPTERDRSSWYFQRYVRHLPAGQEMVIFNRSWYNRAGVERVMGFCTKEEYEEFLETVPNFERLLERSGIYLIKYWFSVSDEQQEARFHERMQNPFKRWKLSPMDLKARQLWVEYSKAKDKMFAYTDTKESPWNVVDADDKKRARLNCIRHLLQQIPYPDMKPIEMPLPPREADTDYK